MKANINDIAAMAGVSKATVSRVINNNGVVKEETRQKVLRAMEALNYSPNAAAKALATSQSNMIGVILPNLDNALYAKAFKGISNTTRRSGYETILFLTDNGKQKEEEALAMCRTHNVLGTILFPTEIPLQTPSSDESGKSGRISPDDELLDELLEDAQHREQGLIRDVYDGPLVIIGQDSTFYQCDAISIDNFRGAYDATNALIQAGHRSIGIMTGDLRTRTARDRFMGFKMAMRHTGLPIEEAFIFRGQFSIESGGELAGKLMSMERRPSAVFISDNQLTMGSMWLFYSRHINIPEDLAIVAFDDGDILQMIGVDLSVVSVDPENIGEVAVKTLIERSQSQLDMYFHRIITTPRLILRGSEEKR